MTVADKGRNEDEPEDSGNSADHGNGAGKQEHAATDQNKGGKKSEEKSDEGGKEDDKKPSPLANPRVRIALIIGAVLAAIALVYWFIQYRTYGQYQQSSNDAYLAADQVNISPRVAGYVEQVLVTDNQIVHAGQVLVRIDQKTSNATATQSRAQIAQAQATVDQARATRIQQYDAIRQARAQEDQSRASLRQNEATNRFNTAQVARYVPLSAVGAETKEKLAQNVSSLEQSREQVSSARAQLAASNAQLASARHQIAINDAQIRSGLAQVASARAQLAANEVDVNAASVSSSIDGRVGDRTVRVGQYVQIGSRMMTVVPVERLYLTANFKETQVGLMRVDQPATIKVDALPNEEIHGVVESFSPGTGSRFAQVPINNATGNFTKIVQRVPVRIRVDAGPEAMRVLVPGLSVSVSVDTRGNRDDRDAQKAESKDLSDGRKQQRQRELDQNRQQQLPGPGR